jgi:hypothetical protein
VDSDEEAGEGKCTEPAIVPRTIEINLRKFVSYVLLPGHESGKDRIFIDRLGFRARNLEDANYLSDLYLNHAIAALAERDYELGETDEFGIRCAIVVLVRSVAIRSGWLLRPDGTFELVTPFAGFAHPHRRRTP